MRSASDQIAKLIEQALARLRLPASQIVNQLSGEQVTPASASTRGTVKQSDSTPQPVGTAAAGTSATVSRSDHVHGQQSHNHTSAANDGGVLTNDEHDGYGEYAEIAAPATPGANKLRLYAKDKSGVAALYYKDDGGTEHDLSITMAIPRQLAWYEDGTLTTGTSKGPLRRIDANVTLSGAAIYVKTAPTGAAIVVDILRSTTGPGGTFTSIFSAAPQIAASAQLGTSTSFAVATLDAGDVLRMDITQVGSTVAGASLTVDLNMTAR